MKRSSSKPIDFKQLRAEPTLTLQLWLSLTNRQLAKANAGVPLVELHKKALLVTEELIRRHPL